MQIDLLWMYICNPHRLRGNLYRLANKCIASFELWSSRALAINVSGVLSQYVCHVSALTEAVDPEGYIPPIEKIQMFGLA